MRLRLGLLQSTAAIDRQTRQAYAAEAAKKHKHPTLQTVKTEEQTKAEDARRLHAMARGETTNNATTTTAHATTAADTATPPRPRIRPLSEAKAIATGASFISEAFLFMVAGGLIVFETYRSHRKESGRRTDVEERLTELKAAETAAREGMLALEREVVRLRDGEKEAMKMTPAKRILPREVWDAKDKKVEEEKTWTAVMMEYYRQAADRLSAVQPQPPQQQEKSKSSPEKDKPATPDEQKPATSK